MLTNMIEGDRDIATTYDWNDIVLERWKFRYSFLVFVVMVFNKINMFIMED